MARYTDESRDRVRDAVDFVELVGSRTELRRAGPNRLTGLCPFHDERTPSFGIDPGEKLYHCFGCGAGGDVFRFVMDTEGVDFATALESLADRCGVQLEREAEDPREAARRARRDRLLALLERTAAYYVRVLWEAPGAAAAREYLAARGLEEATLREFRVGWAPEGWDRVVAASRRAGYSEEELVAAGLAQRARGGRGLIDRFRGRVVFPLADPRGRVLGFGARAVREGDAPKYLNSSDGEVFHKGQQVYAHDLARAAAAREGTVILAEGYTDVIALHQAGVRNVVGLMGTALTPDQAQRLRQLAPAVVLCLDADAAGQEAMARAAELVGGPRREVRVVPLPAGLDPADVIARDGVDAMRALLEGAVPLARFQVTRLLSRAELGTPEGRDRAVEALRPVFAGLPAGVLRDDLISLVADRLHATPDLMAVLLPPGRGGGGRFAPSPGEGFGAGARHGDGVPAGPFPARDGASGASRTASAASVRGRASPATGTASAASLRGPASPATGTAAPWARVDETERAYLARCLAVPEAGPRSLTAGDLDALFGSELTRRAARYLATHYDHPGEHLPEGDAELAHLIAELVVRAADLPADPSALALERLQLDKLRLDRSIAAARRAGEPVAQLAAERQRVHDEIRHRLV